MASLNKVMLIGFTGRDAEMRYLSTGTAKTDFSLAVSSRRRSQSGDWEDQTEWFNIVLFGDRAERVSQYITKGKQLFIEGRLTTRSWEDDQGQKHYRTEVIANNIEFLDRRGGGDGGGDGWGDSAGSNRSRGGSYSDRGNAPPADIDDLPFE